MVNSGYVMIDCTGLELTKQTPQTLPGIYSRTVNAMKTGKFIIAGNATWEDEIMSPVPVMITKRPSGNYIATSSVLQIEIAPDDIITISVMN